MNWDLSNIGWNIVIIVVVIYSIILHEIGHGVAAYLSGDRTAKDAGRITLNPIPHIDLIGSIVLPLIGIFANGAFFGWAKPVPVNPYNYKNHFWGEFFVSLAGVFMNFLVMAACLLIYNQTRQPFLIQIAIMNFSLLYLNLIPIPPLDGYHFVINLLPSEWTKSIRNLVDGREFAFLMILFLIFRSPLGMYFWMPAQSLLTWIFQVFQVPGI